MKHLLLILFTSCLSLALAHTPHHSSHHSYHHSSGHTSTHSYHISHGTSHSTSTHHTDVHPYTHVKHLVPSEVHFYHPSRNTTMYYYLLHNHNTNTNDTIKATSVTELESAVDEVSTEPCQIGIGGVIVIVIILLAVVASVLFFKH